MPLSASDAGPLLGSWGWWVFGLWVGQVVVLALLVLGALWWRQRHQAANAAQLRSDLRADARGLNESLERELRDELMRVGQAHRQDLASFQQMLLNQGGETVRTQSEQLQGFRTQLATLAQQSEVAQRRLAEVLASQLQTLSEANARRLHEVREAVDARLATLQEGNERKLEQMRATVDEKLHATLELRLGESFKQVAERLDQVHRGLGEMQALARDVGALNRVLTNVKTRGVFGEVQLAALLDQVFTPEQYGTNVATVPGSNERVEFAIRLPGAGSRVRPGQGAESGLQGQTATDAAAAAGIAGDEGYRDAPVWLPIDAKFPREDYERLLEAHERADAPAMEQAARALETRLKQEARSIRSKYVSPPHTTDFAILFLPTEGLYAEALRRPGLVDALQRESRVMLAGPTTLLATLTSLQMGFRTLALEQRSAQVWQVLGAVKTEFGKFGEILAKTKKKLAEAQNTIDAAEVRTRAMTRQLRAVEALPESEAAALLPGLRAPGEDDDG